MKLDVEFMEYQVLPDLMLTGVLCDVVDAVMGEFHLARVIKYLWPVTFAVGGRGGEEPAATEGEDGRKNWTLAWGHAHFISQEWLRMVEHNPHCRTRFSMQDDESYRNDGMALPNKTLSLNPALSAIENELE